MKKYIYFLLFIMLSFGTAYADNKKDLFDDYGIYTKEMDEQIITVKKEVYTEIYNIKKLMLENNQKSVFLLHHSKTALKKSFRIISACFFTAVSSSLYFFSISFISFFVIDPFL